jgi:hypothetical protein
MYRLYTAQCIYYLCQCYLLLHELKPLLFAGGVSVGSPGSNQHVPVGVLGFILILARFLSLLRIRQIFLISFHSKKLVTKQHKEAVPYTVRTYNTCWCVWYNLYT